MNDLIENWRKAMQAEARAESETVFGSYARRVDDTATAAKHVLPGIQSSSFLAGADLCFAASLTERDGWPNRPIYAVDALSIAASAAVKQLLPLVERHKNGLPRGRYAVVISFHRIDGGEP